MKKIRFREIKSTQGHTLAGWDEPQASSCESPQLPSGLPTLAATRSCRWSADGHLVFSSVREHICVQAWRAHCISSRGPRDGWAPVMPNSSERRLRSLFLVSLTLVSNRVACQMLTPHRADTMVTLLRKAGEGTCLEPRGEQVSLE